MRVSRELIEDSSFDLSTFLADAFAVRFARGIGATYTSNIITASSLAKQGTTGQTTTVTFDDLCDLFGSVDPLYASSPKAAWGMRLSTLVSILKLKDSQGAPLHLVTRNPNTGELEMFSRPIRICPSVPAMTASAKSILFGAFDRYVIRRVTDSIAIKPLFEKFAEYGQVGYSASMRLSGVLVKAPSADNPIKYYQNSAS